MSVQVAKAVIDTGTSATVSLPVDLGGLTITAVTTPGTLAGTALTFQGSLDGTTYVPIHAPGGGAYSITVATSRMTMVDPGQFKGAKFVKVVSGASEANGTTFSLSLSPEAF